MQRYRKRRMHVSSEVWSGIHDSFSGISRERGARHKTSMVARMLPDMDADMQPVYQENQMPRQERSKRMGSVRSQERKAREKAVTSFGISVHLAWILFLILGLLCLCLFMSGRIQVWRMESGIGQFQDRISNIQQQCEKLQEEYEAAVESAPIAIRARALNMEAPSKENTVVLYAPANAVVTPKNEDGPNDRSER